VITETAPNSWRLFNDYATVERTYPSRRAVVHYVTMGIDAPPLNDDDGSGVADYVERVGEAADASITYYERRGFNPILPDESGPDARPDIYVSRFTPGTFGAAFPAAAAEGGAFCAVANNLDPSAGRSLGSLYGTIAHELFHLVQFSYFPPTTEPSIPTWVLEGSAAGMESRVFPDLDDIVSDLQVWPWLRAPERPITTQNYGSQLLWRYLDHRSPRLLHGYMTRLAQGPVAGRGEQALADTYSRVSGAPFAAVFHDFAVAVAEERPASVTAARVLCQRGRRARVAMFAVHYLRPSVRGGSHVLAVHLGSRTAATFMYTWASDVSGNPAASRRIPAARSDHGRTLTFRLPALLTSSLRFSNPVLILSNGSSRRSAFYQVRLD
jgi:hypothetical protein